MESPAIMISDPRRGRISTSIMGKDRTRRGALVGRAFDEDEGFLGRVRSDGSRPIPDTEAQKKKNDERVD